MGRNGRGVVHTDRGGEGSRSHAERLTLTRPFCFFGYLTRFGPRVLLNRICWPSGSAGPVGAIMIGRRRDDDANGIDHRGRAEDRDDMMGRMESSIGFRIGKRREVG